MIFVDTGAFLAQYHRRDQHHAHAVLIWPALSRPVITSNHILNEVASSLARRAGYPYAADRITDLYNSSVIDILSTTRDDEIEAIRWMRKFADQRVSFTDCVSFALMRRYKIRTAFTFDRHFRLAGFDVIGLR